jgi:L-seryl-tRNA(Ser) seleniumtransferase
MSGDDGRITGLRDFPSIEILSSRPELRQYRDVLSDAVVTALARQEVANQKRRFEKNQKPLTISSLVAAVAGSCAKLLRSRARPVINASGIIVHTNLGRSPLSAGQLAEVSETLTSFNNLEYDLRAGKRGARGAFVEYILSVLCGSEAATVVNNNAGALFLILNTLANRREAIVSRGELVQIGGGFRIPDIMAKSGTKLVEVGTTNMTTVSDYEKAISDRTGIILKVHKSNFAQKGFVEEAELSDLVTLAAQREIPVIYDQGSGLIGAAEGLAAGTEPTVSDGVRSGAALTCFSGDKLLGGPQAGLIVGDSVRIGKIKKNPLFRTLRCDRYVLAVMERVLLSNLKGDSRRVIPIHAFLAVTVGELKARGEKILAACPGKDVVLTATAALCGGGSSPQQSIPSLALSIRTQKGADRLARDFRGFDPPIIGRIENEEFLLDLRCVPEEKDPVLCAAINSLVQ